MSSPQHQKPVHGSSSYFAEFLLILIATIWGVNFVIVKAALSQFLPHTFNGARFILAIGSLLAVMRFKGVTIRLFSKESSVLFLAGVLHTTIYQILFMEGIARTAASNSATIYGAMPMLIWAMPSFFCAILGKRQSGRMGRSRFSRFVFDHIFIFYLEPECFAGRAGSHSHLLESDSGRSCDCRYRFSRIAVQCPACFRCDLRDRWNCADAGAEKMKMANLSKFIQFENHIFFHKKWII